MKKVIVKWTGCVILAAGLLGLGACDKKNSPGEEEEEETVSEETQIRNAFAQLMMTDLYLWNAEAQQVIKSRKLDFQTEPDPIEFYNKLIHADDRWSMMTDDAESLAGQFSGTTTTFGYSLLFIRFVDANGNPTGEYCAVVLFVYADSPAEKAGLKRGDILLGINHAAITENNYANLFYAPSITIDLGLYTGQSIGSKGESVSMTAVNMYEDPIIDSRIIEQGGKKIGYLLYSNYLLGTKGEPYRALDDLFAAFAEFQSEGVDDVVLDLRYNGGGYAITSTVLCDILAPGSALDAKSIMTVEKWNSKYNASEGKNTLFGREVYIREKSGSITEIPISVNMDLNRLYVLTGGNTASASESTIIGLKPYLDLIQIGTTTSGKYYGGIVITRALYTNFENIAALENWGAYTMVYRYTNRDNIAFPDGLAPQYKVEENILNLAPIGDASDPLLAKALELITGTPSPAVRSVGTGPLPYRTMPGVRIKTNGLDGKMIDLRDPELFDKSR